MCVDRRALLFLQASLSMSAWLEDAQKDCWKFMVGEECMLVCRSDSSAARALAGRLGIGRGRHIEANLLWLQQKVAEEALTITPLPTANPADIGTKYMSKVRLNGLKYVIKMVDYDSVRIGVHEYKELEAKAQVRRDVQKFPNKGGFTGRVAMVIALSLMRQSEGRKIEEAGTSVVKFMFSEEITEGRAQVSPLFLCIALLAVIGALSLAIAVWFCGVKVMKMGQNMLAVRMSKENEALKKKIDEDEVVNKNLKRINGLLRDENAKLKKVIESMKKSGRPEKPLSLRRRMESSLLCKWRT